MIRNATTNDLGGIVEIYNQAILARFQTAFTEPFEEEDGKKWFSSHLNEQYPIFVFTAGHEIMGWTSISPYRQGRAALSGTVEISYFVHNEHTGKGIGTQLLNHSIDAAKDLKYKTAIAIILDKNTASTRLAEKSGFEKWGTLPGVAEFGGIECGHLYYGRKL